MAESQEAQAPMAHERLKPVKALTDPPNRDMDRVDIIPFRHSEVKGVSGGLLRVVPGMLSFSLSRKHWYTSSVKDT